jgi:hypothetical protein
LRDEKEKEGPGSGPNRRGRPRRWLDAAEKHRRHRARRRERAELIEAALHAVRNAHWDDAEMERAMNYGQDEDVLRALIAYCQARHWMRWQAQASEGSAREK